jgi:hypothetical protein
LEKAGMLKELTGSTKMKIKKGKYSAKMQLPRQAVSLLEISW